MVWIESTITSSGFTFSICVKMALRLVSHRMKVFSDTLPRRSARSLSCAALSSPDTYRMRRVRIERMFCSSRVDLPMPGSPPISVRLPATRPPPNTRFSSSLGILRRTSSPTSISDSFTGRELFTSPRLPPLLSLADTFASTILFHSPQPGHFPSHLALSYPQLLQKYTVFVLGIIPHLTVAKITKNY